MSFDLHDVPFSRYGSYLTVSYPPRGGSDDLYIRTVHGNSAPAECLKIELLAGDSPVPYTVDAEGHLLRLNAADGFVEMVMPEENILRVRGEGVALRLTNPCDAPFDNAIRRHETRWQLNLYNPKTKLMVTRLSGGLIVDAPWRPKGCERIALDLVPEPSAGGFEGVIEEFMPEWTPRDYPGPFAECVEHVQWELGDWLKKTPRAPRSLSKARELAAYINWASVVPAGGHLTRPGMLMSKRHMTNLWSWDHCFNALALSYHNPELAWDQLMVVFDNQDEMGCLPDALNDRNPRWQYVKPPIHGWTLQRMMERTDWIGTSQLKEIYGPLTRWTNWWLEYRDDDDSGLPAYFHGNDSGWDNGTIFDDGGPIEGPDLAAFLVFQMRVLGEIAGKIGRKKDQRIWEMRAYELLERMIERLWRGDHFIAPRKFDGHVVEEGDCLLTFMPIILGELLPEEVRKALVAGLRAGGRFFTKHGMATESPKSPKYESDGYWRGPIWAPSTMLIADGLAHSGQEGLAHEIARRFCRMCATAGFAENFDAQTGVGLRDRAYTWTSSVFLVLANDYLLEQ
ncbi:MAG: amylo-alpha-1,6-glucosidase [Phycisphaerae bacterium]